MIYLKSFIFCACVCGISQFVLEKTKLTPGHMNTVLVIAGSILSGFKIYDKIIEYFGSGASIVIANFGHLLVSGASDGYNTYGFIGLFKGVFAYASAGISIAIVSAFIVSLLFRIKN